MLFNSLTLGLYFFSVTASPLEALRKNFGAHQGFQVEFSQVVKQSVFPDQKDEASGVVKFHRPHDLRWAYDKPSKRIIEFDGKTLTIDDGKKKEKVTGAAGGDFNFNLQESFSFLWGETNSTAFKVSPLSASSFMIRPKKKSEGSFKAIEVTVKNGFVETAKVLNYLDSESVLHFVNWKFLN